MQFLLKLAYKIISNIEFKSDQILLQVEGSDDYKILFSSSEWKGNVNLVQSSEGQSNAGIEVLGNDVEVSRNFFQKKIFEKKKFFRNFLKFFL